MPPAAPVAVLLVALGWWRGTGWDVAPVSPEPYELERAEALHDRERMEARLLAAADEEVIARAAARLVEGVAVRVEDPSAAAARFQAAGGQDALGDWALLLAADAHARAGSVRAAAAALAHLPPDLALARGWRVMATALLEAGEAPAAADTARTGLGRARTGADSAAARWLAGRALLRAGDTASARPLIREAARTAPPAASAREAAAALERLPAPGPEDLLALVEHRLLLGDLKDAARTADLIPPGVVGAEARGRASLALAGALVARGRFEEAERAAAAASAGVPDEVRASLELVVGRARLRQGRSDPARAALERAVEAAPRSAAAQEALFILADLDEDAGRAVPARRRFGAAADLDPVSDWGAEAAMREGLLALAAGDAAAAALRFHASRTAHPSGWRHQRATYWAALAHLRAGEGALAPPLLQAVRVADPVGYYAMRAAARAGPGEVDPLEGLPAPPPEDAREALLAAGALARVEALEGLGLPEAAALERLRAADALAATPGGLHALAETLLARGRVVDAARAGRAARRSLGRWDARLLRVVYPLPYGEAIGRAARERGVDPALVAALIRQESLFQPHAVSAAGAVGLMQVMPATARGLARRSGLDAPAPAALRDPEINLRLGTLHIEDLLRARDGRVDEVLAAYNAGAGRTARWRTLPGAGDPDAFLERIPFAETREYVRVVQENAAVYRALYDWDALAGPASPRGAHAVMAADERD